MPPVETIIWVVAFVIVTVTVTGLTGRVGWSAPVALVAVGAAVSFIPGVPVVTIEPDLVLYGLLPPILFAAAVRTSIVDVRARGDSILLLSVGAVVFTAAVVGATLWLLLPVVGIAAAFAFGAIVAPTDAVAVIAVAGRAGLPRRLVTVLEGESLLNDATALALLAAATSAIVSVLQPAAAVGTFVVAVVVGVGGGLLVGFVISVIQSRLRAPVLDTSLTLITPFAAFIPAQIAHGSGVLAVVVAGLVLGWRSTRVSTAEARIAESVLWRTVDFLLENAVFLLVGLSLFGIARSARAGVGPGLGPTVIVGVGMLVAILLARGAWVVAATLVYHHGPRRLRERGWSWRVAGALSFTGIRGVVTLAAAFLLPERTPYREFLQLLAFIVVTGTLVAGLALPRIIRLLRLPPPDTAQEDTELQLLLAEASDAGSASLAGPLVEGVEEAVVLRLREDAGLRSRALSAEPEEGVERAPVVWTRLRLAMLAAERDAVLAARSERRYQERAVQDALAFIDAQETALRTGGPGRA